MSSFTALLGKFLPATREEFLKKFGGEKRAQAFEQLYNDLADMSANASAKGVNKDVLAANKAAQAAIRAADASDDMSYPSMAQAMADAVYGDGTAAPSGIRGKDPDAEPEVIERVEGVDASKDTLAGPTKEAAAPADKVADAKPQATQTAIDLAEQYGLDLANIKGTGKGGRIIPKDVYLARKAAADKAEPSGETAAPAAAASTETQRTLPMGEDAAATPSPRIEDAAPVPDSTGALFAGAGPYGNPFTIDTGVPSGIGGMQIGTDIGSLSTADPMNLGLMDLLLGNAANAPVAGSVPNLNLGSFDTGMPMPSAPTATAPAPRSANPLDNLTDADFDSGRYEPEGVVNPAQPKSFFPEGYAPYQPPQSQQSSFFPPGYTPYQSPPPPPVDISQIDMSMFQMPEATPSPVDISQIDMSAFQMPETQASPDPGPPQKWTGVTDTTMNLLKRMGLNTEPGGLASRANVEPVTGFGDAYLRNGLWTIPATAALAYYNSPVASPYATTPEQQQQANDRLKQAEQNLQRVKGAPSPIVTPNWNK